MSATGHVHSFESFATLDGVGIRYEIFLQGCPLRCAVCHNPDTWKLGGGTPYTAEEVYAKARRYKPYFARGGGVTVSGGEPLMQADFLIELFTLLKKDGIDIAIDTSGAVQDEKAMRAVALADMVIVDLKYATEEDYRKYTGGSLERTLKFIDSAEKLGKRIWVRTVIVPGINDTPESVKAYAALLKGRKIEKYELLAFHTMGFYKYEELGIVNPLKGREPLSQEKLRELSEYIPKELR